MSILLGGLNSSMNRRGFFKFLSVLGLAPFIPTAMATTPPKPKMDFHSWRKDKFISCVAEIGRKYPRNADVIRVMFGGHPAARIFCPNDMVFVTRTREVLFVEKVLDAEFLQVERQWGRTYSKPLRAGDEIFNLGGSAPEVSLRGRTFVQLMP